MGFKLIELKLPTGYSDAELKERIGRLIRTDEFSFQIDSKSLDARNKRQIHWLLRVGIFAPGLAGSEPASPPALNIPFKTRKKRILIAGSGPAGFFAAFVLQKAGFDTVILEQGCEVDKRISGIRSFEKSGIFDPLATYAFGEGGAGTFSDGKLTSRSKHINRERDFFLSTYIAAGAPAEIRYLAYPHVGSDNLRKVILNLREQYLQSGGAIRFETPLSDLIVSRGKVREAITPAGPAAADHFIIATGHSSYKTYRMLMNRGVAFRTKKFAIGFRAEHLQRDINLAQWGVANLPGVKAAEYRLTSQADPHHPVYSFCMCPGGMVVPAATGPDVNIVNGMSNYRRDGRFANAGFVAGVHPDQLAGHRATPSEALDWLETLERSFYQYSQGFYAPFCKIRDFIDRTESEGIPETSYPFGLKHAVLWEMIPAFVTHALTEGLRDFNSRIRRYDQGILLGLESKTSSPVQVLREPDGACTGFENLYFAGEGSGYSGGIVSSAADGIRIAMNILNAE